MNDLSEGDNKNFSESLFNFIILMGINLVLTPFKKFITSYVGTKLINQMKVKLFEKIISYDVEFFDNNNKDWINQTMNSDIHTITQDISGNSFLRKFQ